MSKEPSIIVVGKVDSNEINLKWVINKFATAVIESAKTIVLSPVFSVYINNIESKWELQLYPKGIKETEPYASLYLKHLSKRIIHGVVVTFGIIKKDQEIVRKVMDKRTYSKESISWGYPCFIDKNLLTSEPGAVLLDDELTITCKIVIVENNLLSAQIGSLKHSQRLKLFDEFEKLIDDAESSDCVFKVGRKQIHAHKAILSARSAVFAAMFQHNMLEKLRSTVQVKDVSYDILKQIFQYLYTGKVDKIEQKPVDLLIAANKYCLDDLKILCEMAIQYDLNVDNAFEYLSVAESHNAPNLKSVIVEFILMNAKEVADKPKFEPYVESHPRLIAEVFRALASKKPKLDHDSNVVS